MFLKHNGNGRTFSPLRPKRRVQLSLGQQPVLEAGEEGEQVAAPREVDRRTLHPVLADQY